MKYLPKNKICCLYSAAVILCVGALALGIFFGSVSLRFEDIIDALTNALTDSVGARIFLYLRLPRTLATLLTGAALAVAGAIIQNTLSNKLASPSIIGVNSGAGLAVTIASAFSIIGGWQISLIAFLGAIAAVGMISLAVYRFGASGGTVILIGVAINSLFGAISDAIITFDPAIGILSNDFRIGDFSRVTYSRLIPAGVIIILSLVAAFLLRNEIDIITLGEDNARGLGMNTSLMRALFLIIAALLAGASVSIAGLISFVGLLIPHSVRRLCGGSHRHLLPLSALFGAGFVSVCDTVARTLFLPYELPVGIILSFIGAPFFIFILIKSKGGRAL